MPRFLIAYVRWVDRFNRGLGRLAMYGLFVLMGVLLWSSVSKTFFTPAHWTLETAQFAMVAYFVLGGPYSMQLGANVRMDLFYGSWSDRTKAWVDAMTIWFLVFYLAVLIYGALGSLAYSLGYFGTDFMGFYRNLVVALFTGGPDAAAQKIGYVERSSTAWRPYLWPVKLIMAFGFSMMLLQSISEFIKDIARIREVEI